MTCESAPSLLVPLLEKSAPARGFLTEKRRWWVGEKIVAAGTRAAFSELHDERTFSPFPYRPPARWIFATQWTLKVSGDDGDAFQSKRAQCAALDDCPSLAVCGCSDAFFRTPRIVGRGCRILNLLLRHPLKSLSRPPVSAQL